MKRQLVRALSLSVLLTGLIACSQKIDPGTTPGGENTVVEASIATVQETHQPFYYEAVGTVTITVGAIVGTAGAPET